jgi:hypothetical protein
MVGNLTKEENEVMVYLNLVTHHLLLALLQQIALCGLVNVVVANVGGRNHWWWL